MSNITIDRAVVEQALEALEHAARCVQTNYLPDQCGHDWDDQIAFLRAALAQQDEPRNQCGETCERAKLCATCAQVLAQQDEPVQEPEGLDWRYTARIGYVVKPYTAPPQRKPLTKEEIVALIHPIVMADMPDEMTDYEIARAVEAAHGIKE